MNEIAQPNPLDGISLPMFPGQQEVDMNKNYLDAFLEQMQFQLENNQHKGDWLEYVTTTEDSPYLLEHMAQEVLDHAEKLALTLQLYSKLKEEQTFSDVTERYWFQLVAEYAADVGNCAMFAFIGMMNLGCIRSALEHTPVIPESRNDPMRKAAEAEFYQALDLEQPYNDTQVLINQMMRMLRKASGYQGINTQ